MRKILLSVIVTLSCLGTNAQQKSDTLVSISKMTYEGLTELPDVYLPIGWNCVAGVRSILVLVNTLLLPVMTSKSLMLSIPNINVRPSMA